MSKKVGNGSTPNSHWGSLKQVETRRPIQRPPQPQQPQQPPHPIPSATQLR